jgi:hypothetical protein
MSGYIDSVPVFIQRCKEIGFDPAQLAQIEASNLTTMAKFAYSCGFVPGTSDETPLVNLVKEITKAEPSLAELSLFRRLFFEAFTMVQADLRHKIERTEEAPARKLAVPERSARFKSQQGRLNGMMLVGELECADALIDLCVAQYDENRLKYVPWERCLNKASEMEGSKKDTSISKGLNGVLKISDSEVLPDADTSTELLLKNAMTRRSLAYDQANLITFQAFMVWVEKLFTTRLKPSIPGYSRVSVEQMERADKALFVKLAELTRDGITPDALGAKPLDKALLTAMLDHDVNANLIPLPKSSGSAPSNKRPHPSDWESQAPAKKGKGGRGKGKSGKNAKGGSKGTRLPAGLQGTARTPDGANICFAYNLKTCSFKGAGCQRGKHCCTKCYKDHPYPCPN